MGTFRSFTVLAALSLACTAYAQTQATPDTHQRSATRMAAAGKRGVSSGMTVQTPAGDPLGKVAAVVPSTSSSGSYVVIASSTGSATAVPYSTASAMVKNNVLVMDKAQLEKAPKVQQDQTEDGSSTVWQKKADQYWSRYGAPPDQDSGAPR
jgi:hypothetical protein